VKKVFKNISEGKMSIGKPRRRWLNDFENDIKKTDVSGWRKIERDRDAWKLILKIPGSCMVRTASGGGG
jgi:hypothetical protein